VRKKLHCYRRFITGNQMCEAVRNHETTPHVLLGEKQMIRSHLQINENQKITQHNQPVFTKASK
jgi:hypothetical protein